MAGLPSAEPWLLQTPVNQQRKKLRFEGDSAGGLQAPAVNQEKLRFEEGCSEGLHPGPAESAEITLRRLLLSLCCPPAAPDDEELSSSGWLFYTPPKPTHNKIIKNSFFYYLSTHADCRVSWGYKSTSPAAKPCCRWLLSFCGGYNNNKSDFTPNRGHNATAASRQAARRKKGGRGQHSRVLLEGGLFYIFVSSCLLILHLL